jgi:hypothetical protein
MSTFGIIRDETWGRLCNTVILSKGVGENLRGVLTLA